MNGDYLHARLTKEQVQAILQESATACAGAFMWDRDGNIKTWYTCHRFRPTKGAREEHVEYRYLDLGTLKPLPREKSDWHALTWHNGDLRTVLAMLKSFRGEVGLDLYPDAYTDKSSITLGVGSKDHPEGTPGYRLASISFEAVPWRSDSHLTLMWVLTPYEHQVFTSWMRLQQAA